MTKFSSTSCLSTRANDCFVIFRISSNSATFRSRIAVHEVQHAVMRPPETVLLQDGIGIAGEIAIGEIKKLDARNEIGRYPFTSTICRLGRTS